MMLREIFSRLTLKLSHGVFFKILTFAVLQLCALETQSQVQSEAPGRPNNHEPYIFKYSTQQLKKYTKQHLKKAKKELEDMEKVIYNGPYKATFSSLKNHPTPEWYQDAKFGIALNYGLYNMVGHGAQGYGGNFYTDTYLDHIYKKPTKGEYHIKHWGADFEKDDFIQYFTAEAVDADAYIQLFKEAGARYFVQFNTHRSTGMPLWNSSFTFRDPVDMNPNRDITGEFIQACRKHGLPYGFYLNLEDSEYPLLNEKGEIRIRKWTFLDENQKAVNGSFETTYPYDPNLHQRRLQGKIPIYDYVNDYLLPLSKEFIDKYEPEYLWFDGGWRRPSWYYRSHEIVAYYYNKFEGKKDVMVNARMGKDVYGMLGDVVTSEGGQFDNHEELGIWEEARPIGKNFAYDWQEHDGNVMPAKDLLHMFIRIVAQGGNLLLIISPDGKGVIPDYQKSRLKFMGNWLKTNGEAIYDTRRTPWISEENILGQDVFYTQSKDGKYTYAICLKLQGAELILSKVKAKQGTEIRLLGFDKPISYVNPPWGLTLKLPKELQNDHTWTNKSAWVFRFEVMGETEKIPAIQAE